MQVFGVESYNNVLSVVVEYNLYKTLAEAQEAKTSLQGQLYAGFTSRWNMPKLAFLSSVAMHGWPGTNQEQWEFTGSRLGRCYFQHKHCLLFAVRTQAFPVGSAGSALKGILTTGTTGSTCAGHYERHFLRAYYHWIKAFEMRGRPLPGTASFDSWCGTIWTE